MLGNWRTHEEYQSYLVENIIPYFLDDRKNVEQYKTALSKLYIPDLDPLKSLLANYYSITVNHRSSSQESTRTYSFIHPNVRIRDS